MIVRKLLFIFFCIQIVTVSATPMLDIVISDNKVSGIQVAVLPFTTGKAQIDLRQVISNDLASSGQFRVLPSNLLPQNSKDPITNANLWRRLKVANLITGSINVTKNGNYDVAVKLYEVAPKSGNAKLLIHKLFTNKKQAELRYLAHHISDIVFENLLGIRGVFSTKIAYIAMDPERKTNSLIVADSDGGKSHTLLRSNYTLMSPSWSPDASKIAFVSFAGNRSAIRTIELTTGKTELISQVKGINGAPAWSPDGKKLVAVLSKDGAPKLYLIDLKTKAMRKLTKGSSIDTEPNFTPDGNAVIFTSTRSGRPQIHQLNLNDKKVKRLTFNGNYNSSPSITPDGSNLVMMHRANSAEPFCIAVQNLISGKFKVVTYANSVDSPAVAPNGMMILYSASESGRSSLGAISLDGRVKIRLALADVVSIKDPAWSPFQL